MLDGTRVGVVILNYKDAKTTMHLCNLIKNYNVIDRIVLVDNLSPDDSYEELKKLKNSKIDVISTDRNGGYSYGNNYGAFYLIVNHKVDVLLIANPDVEFTEEHVETLVKHLNKGKFQAVSGVMKNPDGSPSRWNGRINTWFEALIDSLLFLRKLLNLSSFDYAQQDDEYIYVDFLPGSLFAINAKAFSVIMGFDDNVFLYFEECIMRSRFDIAGFKLALIKNTSFIHNHSVSINKSINKIEQIKQYNKSKLYYYTTYKDIDCIQCLILKLFLKYGLYIRKILYKFY